MPSKLPPQPSAVKPGCTRCNKMCATCMIHLTEGDTFRSHVTGENFHMRHSFSCHSANIIYLLECDKSHVQYVGATMTSFKTRVYQHRSNINLNKGTWVTKHFNVPGNSLFNVKGKVIEKVYAQSKEVRLRRESFWINKLKTL